jgi:glycosyltransferase involved in cell wall biosynthesis
MRLAYVCADPGVPVFGRKGCSVHVQEVLRAFTAVGAEVDLFAARPEGEPAPGLEKVRLHALPPVAGAGRAAREQAALAANPIWRAALERDGPFDLLYERYSLWSFAGMEYARATRVPGLLEVNAPLIAEQAQHRGLSDRTGAEGVAARVFAAADFLVAVSDEVKRYLEQHAVARGRVHVIPNGVNPDRFPPDLTPSRPGPAGTFTVGFLGTLKPWHGLATLVEAFALFRREAPDSRFLVVGDGPERARLEEDLAGRDLRGAAHLTGSVAPAEIPGLLASMDVGVAPYPLLPGFYFSPLKVYEYMAAGLPVVASRIGQLAGLITHETDGLLCPPGDAAALAGALGRLYRRPTWRKQLGRAGRAAVLGEHTWDGVVRRIAGLAGVTLPAPRTLPSPPSDGGEGRVRGGRTERRV